eukprot:4988025-Pyramimonas_sp.AAC.1
MPRFPVLALALRLTSHPSLPSPFPLHRISISADACHSRHATSKLPCDVPNPCASNGKRSMPTLAGTATV